MSDSPYCPLVRPDLAPGSVLGAGCVADLDLPGLDANRAITGRVDWPPTREQMAALVRRVAELEVENARLAELVVRDPLTVLLNRRGLLEGLAAALARRARNETPLCLAICDLDHFKAVNDSAGHPSGDLVLARVGRLLGARVRQGEIVGRLGGDEFALVLEADMADALAVCERLRDGIAALTRAVAPLAVTASFGVAQLREDARAGELMRAADRALYRAKAGGRDQVTGEPPTPA